MRKIYHITDHLLHFTAFVWSAVLFFIAPHLFFKKDSRWLPFISHDYAHRGLFDNGWDIPENSMPAFKKAIAHGYGIELDVHITADHALIVHHDNTLYRMCRCESKIKDMTLEEIKSYHLLNTEEKIPTFQEVLKLVHGQVPLLIELKTEDQNCTALCKSVAAALENYPGDYMIESFNPLALRWFRKNHPQVLRGQLSCNFYKEKPHCDFVLFMITVLGSNFLARPDFISYKYSDIKNPMVFLNCNLLNAKLGLWTIKSKETYDTYKNHSDFLIFEGFEPQNKLSC